MAMPNKLEEQRKQLVDKIVADMEAGKTFFWEPGYTAHRMVNAVTGKPYRGGNAISLMAASEAKGYDDPRWCTFNQAKENGWHVKKGEKGTSIEVWKAYEVEKDKEGAEGEEPEKETRFWRVAGYTVFNAKQIDGIPALPERTPEEIAAERKKQIAELELLIQNSEAAIYHDQTGANFYSPSDDTIHVVPQDEFNSIDQYYATVSHEIAHSTGAEHRLNRNIKNVFGTKDYAKEELRAEMASMFIQQEYNIRFDEKHYENHAAYLTSWAQVLKRDPNELYRAARDAEKAVDYMKSRMIERDLKKEETKEHAVQILAEREALKNTPQERQRHNIQRTIELKPRKRRVVARRSPAKERGRERALSR